MKIAFILTGRIKKGYIREGFRDYTDRIQRHCAIEVFETRLPPPSLARPKADALREEAAGILEKIKDGDLVAALSMDGAVYSSEAFSRFMEKALSSGRKRVVFVIGGPDGLAKSVLARADRRVSLSAMTFTHELSALVLAEQVYRAFTVIKHEPFSR